MTHGKKSCYDCMIRVEIINYHIRLYVPRMKEPSSLGKGAKEKQVHFIFRGVASAAILRYMRGIPACSLPHGESSSYESPSKSLDARSKVFELPHLFE